LQGEVLVEEAARDREGCHERELARPKKSRRFQATFGFSLFPDRHARPEHGGYARSAFALLLPAAAFAPHRISAPERLPRPPYPEPALRDGVSLAPVAVPFRAPPRGVNVPRLPLQPNPESAFQPVRFATPGLAPLLHCLRGADPRCVPVAGRRLVTTKPPSAFTPPWDGVPRDQRACRHQPVRLSFALNPISIRSPLPALFYRCQLRIIVPGSLSLARLAVPSDLLEPST
jgi:hypothetical protein